MKVPERHRGTIAHRDKRIDVPTVAVVVPAEIGFESVRTITASSQQARMHTVYSQTVTLDGYMKTTHW